MRLKFDLNNNVEKPEIILGRRNYDKFGSIVHFDNLTYEYNLMSTNSVSFTVYKELNGEKERLWEEIRDRRLVWLKEFNEWFQIDVTINEENGIKKEVNGTALCESELSQIIIRGAEINTEDDIAREEYINPTVFYKPSNPKESLLHRLLKEVPNYYIKHVDESLWDIQRTFSIDGTTVYDTLMNEIAEEIGCLFLFDSTDRSVSVYDLKTNCLNCGHRADYTDICPECESKNLDYGYGYDTTIFVDSETLAQNISLTGKQDEVKNYIRVSGGDEMVNAAIAACNPSGSQYIYTFSKADKEDMSETLSKKLEEYQKEFDRLTPVYQDIMKDLYNMIDEQLRLESSMMPDIKTVQTTATKELEKLTSANLSPVAVTDVSVASVYTANNAVLGMAKCLVNSTVYKVSLIEGSTSLASQTWKGKFRLVNQSDEEDSAENTDFITIMIDDDYEHYVKQKIQKTIDRDDIYLVDIFDLKTDLNAFKAELKKYCLNRLNSFESAYQSVIDVLIEANCANYSTYGDIYNALYLPYYNKLMAIQKEIQIRGNEIKAVEERLDELEKAQTEITEYLNIEHFLGESLWKELCSFRREDSFENSNYISDGLDNTELLEKAQELLEKAKIEAITASTLQMSLSTSMFNLLAISEFQKLTGMFEGGNWIRIKVDNKIYRLRLIHYKINFSEIQNIEVEFSDVTETANGLNDTKSLMDKVQSMSGSFSFVAHQAEQGSKSFTELDKIRNNGLNTALYKISNSINQEFVIDEHGITGRQWDDIQGAYSPEQLKISNNLLVYTDNYWQTAKLALGKIQYYDPIRKTEMEKYGLIAEAVISGILMSNDIIGGNIYSENYSAISGTHIDLNNGDFSFAGGKLTYDSEKNALNLTGKITFEAIDYKDNETMKIVKNSLGVTQIENDMVEALGMLNDISSDDKITPTEKLQLLDKFHTIKASHEEFVSAYGTSYKNISEYTSYISAYNSLYDMLYSSMGILSDMAKTYDMTASGNYDRSSYDSIISTYYSKYQILTNKITADMQNSIHSVSGIADKVQKSLGWTTEIDGKSVIAPYMEGGYLYITAPSKGSVIIDPLAIKNSAYIFAVYNPENKLVMGVDTSGNGIFEGKITAKLGNIAGWNIDSHRLYMANTGISSYDSYYAFWAGETNEAGGTVSSNAKFSVTHDGKLTAVNADITGKIIAEDGKIGGWNINAYSIYRNYSTFGTSGGMYFGTNGLSIGSNFKVTSGGTVTANGTFTTGTNTYAKLSSGSLTFYRDNNECSSFSTTYWDGTSIYGTGVHSEYKSSFISFGNKTSASDTTYVTKFLLNYGLNPDGRTQGVQVFDNMYVNGNILCTSIDLRHSVGNIKLSAINVDNSYLALTANNFYTDGNLYVGGTKNRSVVTEHYDTVCLSAYETATPYFGDIGSGICDESGLCYIYLDEIFKETVIIGYKYYVFLQAVGETDIILIKQNEDYFIVKGKPYQEFNFEIKCRQKGTETNRLDRVYFEESEDII